MATIVIPSFDFSGFYYSEILESLVNFKRLNVPELSDESPQEPFMQLIRAFALVGHLNNTLADMIANESTLPTAQLVETVRNMLRLIDFEMRSAAPARVDIVYELSTILTSTQEVIPVNALAEASAQGVEDAKPFQVLTALNVDRTDQFSMVLRENQYVESGVSNLSSTDGGINVILGSGAFGATVEGQRIRLRNGGTGVAYRSAVILTRIDDTHLKLDSIGLRDNFTNLSWEILADDVFTDVTANMNSAAGGTETTPWPTNVVVKDALYLGHAQAMWDELNVTIDTAGSGITGVWEYYDGTFRQAKADSITDLGNGQLRLVINGLLGTTDRKGTEVRVQLDENTAFELVDSEFDTVNYVVVSLLGQSSPSLSVNDYTIGSTWHLLSNVVDGTSGFTTSGDITYTLPQSLTEDWNLLGLNSQEAHWLRFRIVATATPVSPIIDQARMDTGKQYLKSSATQGRTQTDDPLGSSDGTANQKFTTSRDFYIDGTAVVAVDDIEWTRVANFLSSKPTDRHYVVELQENDRASILFGDGVTGLIPATGTGNISVSYRYNAETNGNVGAITVISDKTGLRLINRLYNPRPAFGWREADGASEESLARVKLEGPASLRVKKTALNGDDAAILATLFTDTDGARPVARAIGIEEGFGPKTVELVVVGAGGNQVSDATLDALDEYFNGSSLSSPPKPKRFVANQEVVTVNFTEKSLLLQATVTVVRNSTLTGQQVKNALLVKFQPLALRDASAEYEWEFGENIPLNRINHEIFDVSDDILDAAITLPVSDVDLALRELPVLDPLSSITVVSV